jgi:inhibitor of KinA
VSSSFRIVPAGDATLLLQFEDRIDPQTNASVVDAAASLARAAIPGVRDIVPTFRSVAVYFDPLRTRREVLIDALRRVATPAMTAAAVPSEPIRVPVCYGGELGPDLTEVAAFAKISEAEVAAAHASVSYRVFMLGFVPGFAYMGSVVPRIAAPRRSSPRLKVPPGSVAIARQQTGVYPTETPGGWQLIGRTPLKTFDLDRPQPCLFKPGDTVRFYQVARAQYDELLASSPVSP